MSWSHLNEHSRNVHDSTPRKEDYWQDVISKVFQCENCTENFTRKNDLKLHMKIRHYIQSIFKCDQCNNSYRYQKNLQQHKLEKHGPELKRYACPDCGKVFFPKKKYGKTQAVTCKSKLAPYKLFLGIWLI